MWGNNCHQLSKASLRCQVRQGSRRLRFSRRGTGSWYCPYELPILHCMESLTAEEVKISRWLWLQPQSPDQPSKPKSHSKGGHWPNSNKSQSDTPCRAENDSDTEQLRANGSQAVGASRSGGAHAGSRGATQGQTTAINSENQQATYLAPLSHLAPKIGTM